MRSPRNYTGLRGACSVRPIGEVGSAAVGELYPIWHSPREGAEVYPFAGVVSVSALTVRFTAAIRASSGSWSAAVLSKRIDALASNSSQRPQRTIVRGRRGSTCNRIEASPNSQRTAPSRCEAAYRESHRLPNVVCNFSTGRLCGPRKKNCPPGSISTLQSFPARGTSRALIRYAKRQSCSINPAGFCGDSGGAERIVLCERRTMYCAFSNGTT